MAWEERFILSLPETKKRFIFFLFVEAKVCFTFALRSVGGAIDGVRITRRISREEIIPLSLCVRERRIPFLIEYSWTSLSRSNITAKVYIMFLFLQFCR